MRRARASGASYAEIAREFGCNRHTAKRHTHDVEIEAPTAKLCPRCDTVKPLEEFPPAKRGKHGRYAYCLPCKREYAREKRRRVAPEVRQGWERKRTLRRYGITPEDYDRMLEEQGGGCAICGKTPEEEGKNLGVDHCHSTGIVRGLLCRGCNQGLGHYRDRADWLDKASAYLRERSGVG